MPPFLTTGPLSPPPSGFRILAFYFADSLAATLIIPVSGPSLSLFSRNISPRSAFPCLNHTLKPPVPKAASQAVNSVRLWSGLRIGYLGLVCLVGCKFFADSLCGLAWEPGWLLLVAPSSTEGIVKSSHQRKYALYPTFKTKDSIYQVRFKN